MRQLLRRFNLSSVLNRQMIHSSNFETTSECGCFFALRLIAQRLSLAERPRSCFFLLLADDLDHVRGVRSQRAVRRTSIHL